jgi:hypothetical protein
MLLATQEMNLPALLGERKLRFVITSMQDRYRTAAYQERPV